MPDQPNVIHQVEYRWQHEKDLSPYVTTMSEPETAGWNEMIRPWVRHPNAAEVADSVCYKTWDDSTSAALAWRYRDSEAAGAEDSSGADGSSSADSSSGRPRISRVLIGHTSLLTPEAAIVICLRGLPSFVNPDRADIQGQLSAVNPEEITSMVEELKPQLDEGAAQVPGLPELLAAAISDRQRPLAVYLPTNLVTAPLEGRPQGWLLWGLHRIMRAMPPAGRRGWSFSTFELPPGGRNAATLPDIVFREDVPADAGGIVRDEVKTWPFDPEADADLPAENLHLAYRIVGAYAKAGVEGVRGLYTAPNKRGRGAGRSVQWPGSQPDSQTSHVQNILGPYSSAHTASDSFLHSSTAPSSITAPPSPVLTGSPQTVVRDELASSGPPDASDFVPSETEGFFAPSDLRLPEPPVAAATRPDGLHPDVPPNPLTSSRDGAHAPGLALEATQIRPNPSTNYVAPDQDGTGFDQTGPDQTGPDQGTLPYLQGGGLDFLLEQMLEAENVVAVQEILAAIVAPRPDSGRGERQGAGTERQKARQVMAREDWYDRVTHSSGYRLRAQELAGIIRVIVIPDLGKADVSDLIGDWADGANRETICGLLISAHGAMAAKGAGGGLRKSKNPVEQIRQIMQPRLADRWAREQGLARWWNIGRSPNQQN